MQAQQIHPGLVVGLSKQDILASLALATIGLMLTPVVGFVVLLVE
jgi:hypothetical protein